MSAVDAHVGKHIFDEIIGPDGLLAKKTRILVTHGLTYLKRMDEILVVADGEISERGTYNELLENKGAFADFMLQYLTEEAIEDSEDADALKDLEAVMGKDEIESKIRERRSSEQRKDSATSHASKTGSRNGSSLNLKRSSSREQSPRKRVVSAEEKPPVQKNNKQ